MTTVLDTATIREIRTVTGRDVATVPVPGRAVVFAGVGGTGVSSVIGACARVAPDLVVGDWADRDPGAPDAAAVAVLVVDPSSSVDEEESALLAELRQEIGVVALVCNKIDAYWEWPDMLRRIRAVLDPAGRLPLFAVAARRGDSGIAALTDWLTCVVSAPDEVRHGLRQAGVGLVEADAVGAVPLDDDAARLSRDLVDRRRVILAGRDRGRAERYAAVRVEFAAARAEIVDELDAVVRTLSAVADARCDRLGRHEVALYRTWFDGLLTSAAGHLDQLSASRLAEAAAVGLAGIGGFAGAGPAPAAHPVVIAPAAAAGPRRGAEDALFALLGVSTGFGVGRAVGAAASSMDAAHVPDRLLTPVTVLTGLAIAVWVIGVRRTSATRARLRAATAAAIAELRTTGERLVLSRSSSTEIEVTGQIGRYHDRLGRDTGRQVAAIDADLARHRDRVSGPRAAVRAAARELGDRLAVLTDPDPPAPDRGPPRRDHPEPGGGHPAPEPGTSVRTEAEGSR
ncbi:hypothetical protein GII33_01580 [Gordonia pseudamarae]|uniref:Dynamin family protein n=1 Tax=Gordonia pseudamarae TaxID=2831662 RepID=A0ABX6IEP0_9ACTN|nr:MULTISPECIES: hypothetical protein [Gordonia]MBD0021989.1 hypothetical protein [Gordonia sp. (in: high G+C Gram-positive bacteria)]QHN24854.1 hypothetical protein GII33_01580 [Gordonia pseudamarae]QHN33786.1 hypothetical protein GII31_01575 [Gordonia pseudamarae]